MHSWCDENVDWKGIDSACSYIGKNLSKFGRVNVSQYKEKWGTCRIYCSFGIYSLHCFIYPGLHLSKFPKWLWKLDVLYISKFIGYLFNWWLVPYQKWLYHKLYKDMVLKYPHLKKEILTMADFPELLEDL